MNKFSTIVILIGILMMSSIADAQKGSVSVFNEGSWYKIPIVEKGIYKLDEFYLSSLGIDIATINPKHIKIYSNGGGGMLPQRNDDPRTDLLENAIFVAGEDDDQFNSSDYVLFFANESDYIGYNEETGRFSHEKNLYSDTAFYFLTIDNGEGKRIDVVPSIAGDHPQISTFQDYLLIEEDVSSVRMEGRRWFGQKLSSGTSFSQSFNTGVNGITGSTIRIETAAVSISDDATSMNFNINGSQVANLALPARPDGQYDPSGLPQAADYEIENSSISSLSSQLDIVVEYSAPSSGLADGYLDFIFLEFDRDLKLYGSSTFFRSVESLSNSTSEFVISVADNAVVWDITEKTAPSQVATTSSGGQLTFNANSSELREYVVFNIDATPNPMAGDVLNNENILVSTPPQGVIVTYPGFQVEAERLADFHRTHDGLDVKVVTTTEIYNEFSSGMQDISAIRDYMKYLYDLDDGQRLRYLLLFGDCSYDYKKRFFVDQNFVPIYEARESMHPIYSYSSDDYFGFLEDDEGEWIETSSGDHTLEIGVGRLPVKNLEEARIIVDKIIRYETSNKVFGAWRNDVYFVADDGDSNIHQRDAERLSEMIDTTNSAFNSNKVYLDAFQQEPGPPESSIQTNNKIIEILNKGALIVNYTGHGNFSLWADENILTKTEIRNLTNRKKLPLFVTATCEFGKYDSPLADSGGEALILNPNGGAIGLVTTTRPVFAHTNFVINRAFYEHVFELVDGQNPRLGDIIRRTKNNSLRGPVNRNFSLLGDPMMRLAIPDNRLEITAINSGNTSDTLSALGKILVTGQVTNQVGEKINDFHGLLTAKVFDKPSNFLTLGNQNSPFNYSVRNTLLFNGEATISNGDFQFEFVVPKNIAYNFDKGKISLYAVSSNQEFDASGADIDVVVGGSSPDVDSDTTPPDIWVYMNDSTFKSGGTVNPNPLLLAKIFDENGINISNRGLGQNLTGTLDDEIEIDLNEFYTASRDSYQEGWISYPLNNLAVGRHTLKIKVWDTYNNSSESTVEFVVSTDARIIFYEVYNYPNPMTNNTTFYVAHDRDGEELLVDFEIFSISGSKVLSQQYRYTDPDAIIDDIVWDGKDLRGSTVENGVYIYKFKFRSTLDGATNEIFRRLVISN